MDEKDLRMVTRRRRTRLDSMTDASRGSKVCRRRAQSITMSLAGIGRHDI
jgi:hypothetical protein